MRIFLRIVVAVSLGATALVSWSQVIQPSNSAPPSPGQHGASVFQASFPAYRVHLRETTELGAIPALEVYRNEQLMFRFPGGQHS